MVGPNDGGPWHKENLGYVTGPFPTEFYRPWTMEVTFQHDSESSGASETVSSYGGLTGYVKFTSTGLSVRFTAPAYEFMGNLMLYTPVELRNTVVTLRIVYHGLSLQNCDGIQQSWTSTNKPVDIFLNGVDRTSQWLSLGGKGMCRADIYENPNYAYSPINQFGLGTNAELPASVSAFSFTYSELTQ